MKSTVEVNFISTVPASLLRTKRLSSVGRTTVTALDNGPSLFKSFF